MGLHEFPRIETSSMPKLQTLICHFLLLVNWLCLFGHSPRITITNIGFPPIAKSKVVVPTCLNPFFVLTGLGQHGLVGTSDESLLSLHEALRAQFEVVQKTYSEALTKLESLKGQHKSQNQNKAPIAQSHQRQLSLKASEIQERLIKNKTLLNVVEPTLENHSLEVLLGKK